MSKIEVNTVAPQCGTTLTLGESGDTVTLGTGASQSGFGRTGTVDWQTGSIKTATFTAANGEGYFCNTAGGAFEMDLPAGSAGAIVSVQDYNNTFDTNALTVDPNGSEKINGGDAGEEVTLDTEGRGVTFVYIDATVGWRSVQDNDFTKKGVNAAFVAATGGTITTVCTNFKVHTFTSPGTFCVSCAGNAGGSNTVSYMVVAGGGGTARGGPGAVGGGGAGGFREGRTTTCSYTVSPLNAAAGIPVTATGFPITVGAGGASGPSGSPGNASVGSNTIFSTITSAGGGRDHGTPGPASSNGGSGGGGPTADNPTLSGKGNGNTPPVSPPQGNPGGGGQVTNPGSSPALVYRGGGGGGATAVGANAVSPGAAGAGGAGATTSINATPTAFAGGGGGAAGKEPAGVDAASGAGGAGGGGAGGARAAGTAGTANTGGGAGGAGYGPGGTVQAGAAGGSGIVIIRYKFQ